MAVRISEREVATLLFARVFYSTSNKKEAGVQSAPTQRSRATAALFYEAFAEVRAIVPSSHREMFEKRGIEDMA